MGRTPIPLTILVEGAWLSTPQILALTEKGHTTLPFTPGAVDLILHSRAHWWADEMFSKPIYLEAALKAARKRRR